MSITGAVAELNKEIERLTQIRDSLLQGASETATRSRVGTTSVALAKKAGRKKSAKAKKSILVKTSAPAAKRVVSTATRKKMSDAAKARAAAKKTATAK